MISEHYEVPDGKNIWTVDIHHNGDYSGEVIIDVHKMPAVFDGTYKEAKIEVPFEVLRDFVAGYVQHKLIERAETASPEELLRELQ